ncbi:MAG: DUF11 domain-containing protein [Proteobacteria bacterium]|nr:DUF11 domain-containing protein [Pseudomonadota bacterium]
MSVGLRLTAAIFAAFAVPDSFATPPAGTSITNTASASFVDSGSATRSAQSNTATLAVASVLDPTVTVSLAVSSRSAAPMSTLTYTVVAANSGSLDATGTAVVIDGTPTTEVVLRDPLPPHTTFASFGSRLPSGLRALYHIAGTPIQTYVSSPPGKLTTVDAVAFAEPTLAAGAQLTGSFTITVNGNAGINGNTAIDNTATLYTSAGGQTAASNPVSTTLSPAPGSIDNYADSDRKKPAPAVAVGSPLYLTATAAACNADPTVRESHTVAIVDSSGDRETFTATESGVNTGVFQLPPIPTAVPPIQMADGTVEGRHGDTITIAIPDCGIKVQATLSLVDPAGVVFDSKSNAPVAYATVTLRNASENSCTTTPVSVSESDSSGQYHFPTVAAGKYCVAIEPPPGYAFPSTVAVKDLPAGRRIVSTGPASGGSYGGVFTISTDGTPVIMDMPLDPHAITGLFVQKTASKARAEVGDFVDYAVVIANQSGVNLPAGGVLLDRLPTGFIYRGGSARLNGAHMADPRLGSGAALTFSLPALPASATPPTLTYRVELGPSALSGDGINRAQAQVLSAVSNVASASVQIDGGVFGNDTYIIGKVYLDCNNNQVNDDEESGIPGVRLYLEDGTSVVTDEEGKYSLYGIAPKTHVLKLDRSSLPAGAQLEVLSNRNAGDPGSVFVDARNGELHKANFAVNSCGPQVLTDIVLRFQNQKPPDRLVLGKLDADSSLKPLSDVRALPASGVIAANTGPVAPAAGFIGVAGNLSQAAPAVSGLPQAPLRQAPVPALESLLPSLDNSLEFVGLTDQAVLTVAQTNIRVKGPQGSAFVLRVNGTQISPARVGKKSVLASRELQAWEYFGIDLKPGINHLQLTLLDRFGHVRGEKSIDVTAPDRLGTLELKVLQEVPANGASAARVLVRLTDAKGTPVTVRTPVTLESSAGQWDTQDLDPREPGTQVFIEGGSREFRLVAPRDPVTADIRATSGMLEATTHATFLPDLRPMIASGVIEGVLNLRRLSSGALTPVNSQDGFEQQLKSFARSSVDGRQDAAARAAVFLKGKVRGDYLLTLGYDSDKDTRERLFRDIQPDRFYPVYGDSSVRGFDAQSTSRLYVRLDKGRSWLLYGDMTTQSAGDVRQLSNYARSLTGIKEHYETGRMAVNAFASKDSTVQVIDELPANGTSGPFTLSSDSMVENSERVELLLRDRNQPSLIIQTTPLQRFSDYEIEPLTGRLLLKGPIASLDPNFNPQSLRVTYEVNQGGQKFWVAGIDGQFKLASRVEVGGVFVDDRNPANPATLAGANSTVKLGQKTYVIGEYAATDNLTAGRGAGERLEIKHDSGNLQARIYADKTDVNFNNPGASVTPGRDEAGARVAYRINDTLSIHGEALHSEDESLGGKRDGAIVTVEKQLPGKIKVEAGVRKAHETVEPASTSSAGSTPTDLDSVRLKVTSPVPHAPQADIYGEYEQDIRDSDKRIAAVGAEYQIANRGRLYFRDEFISSLSGPYTLNSVQKQNATVFGIDSDYMHDGRVFSEYRIRDAYSGGESEAAIGLRNRIPIEPGLAMTTTFERVHTLSGSRDEEAIAGSVGVDYTANPLWKGSGRIEVRDATSTESVLTTFGIADKLTESWTGLIRDALAIERNTGSGSGQRLQERLQAGVAYRDTASDVWNVLALVEQRFETDDTRSLNTLKQITEIASLSANAQLSARLVLTMRTAAKWVQDDSNQLASHAATQLVSARITYDLTKRWDIGAIVSSLLSDGFHTRQAGFGVEAGYNVAANLWLSAGFNVFGYREEVLAANDYSNRGVYLRIRFKFDEALLEEASGGFGKPIAKPVTGRPE